MEPIDIIDVVDTGDDTQLRFHYQYAYGVILALSAISKAEMNVEFWFEQHEDILRRNEDGYFSYFQIKTRKPEIGHWTLTSDALLKSIKKFTNHESKFSSNSTDYYFVSNARYQETNNDIKDKKKMADSPVNFFQNIDIIINENCPEHFSNKFKELLNYCGCDQDLLKSTLKKIKLINGPSYESIDSDLSSLHLFNLKYCKHLKLRTIHKIRDELIYNVSKASSLIIETVEKHLFNIIMDSPNNPVINSKKITVKEFESMIENSNNENDIFRYLPSNLMTLGNGGKNLPILNKKLKKGGLENSLDSMERRALSAEYNLIEVSIKEPDRFKEILNQLENVVVTEASDIKLINTDENVLNSSSMMKDFILRMRDISKNDPERVLNNNFDMLMGIAGLLTGECKIWWSEKFNLDEYK